MPVSMESSDNCTPAIKWVEAFGPPKSRQPTLSEDLKFGERAGSSGLVFVVLAVELLFVFLGDCKARSFEFLVEGLGVAYRNTSFGFVNKEVGGGKRDLPMMVRNSL